MLLEVATVQAGPIKILFESLTAYLIDVNLEFIPVDENNNEDNAGIKILALNAKEGMLVHVKLIAKGFNKFYCTERQILGVNMQALSKIIRSMSNSDILTIKRYNTQKDKNKLLFIIENMEKNQMFNYNLPLIDVDSDILDISSASFQALVIMSSNDFQKVCRDMNGIEAKYVDLTLVKNVFKISSRGEIAEGCAEFRETSNDSSGVIIKRNNSSVDDIIFGRYELKNLILFTKCTNLCNHIEIYLQNDFPLLVKYTVATLGYVHLCQSPITVDS